MLINGCPLSHQSDQKFLQGLKERLVERANIIAARKDMEVLQLNKRQVSFAHCQFSLLDFHGLAQVHNRISWSRHPSRSEQKMHLDELLWIWISCVPKLH